jgi:Cu/Ag efflux protein CusF
MFFVATFLAANQSAQPKVTQTTGQPAKVQQVSPGGMTVKIGDATTTYTFDNKTVFTYGDHQSDSRGLKIGDEVFVRGMRNGKASKVSVTQRIEGVIEKIDDQAKKLTIRVGDTIKEIPFDYFLVATPDGKSATVEDMKAGDQVLLNVNVGFATKHP